MSRLTGPHPARARVAPRLGELRRGAFISLFVSMRFPTRGSMIRPEMRYSSEAKETRGKAGYSRPVRRVALSVYANGGA
jgi:hypothetical protein